jgi:hypothetical protein
MGRSAVLVGVLASGAFLVLSVEVFRKKEGSLETAAHSGTGGYALWGELSSPVYEDLNQVSVRDQLGLGGESVRQVTLLRKREGDEASCLNLNRALEPQLLGVPSLEWEKRGAFRFSAAGQSWAVLRSPLQDGTIPAVVDEATMRWALQKKVGDILMLPDGRGGRARLRIVAALQGSLLQGALMIEEADFVRLYPDLGGYRALLVDADAQELDAVRSGWSRALADRGLELVRSSRRLAELDAVANAYLSIFQVLGGLGVLLGTLGGGVVAARNIVERRSELALLQAAGWRLGQVRRMLAWEHLGLVVLGVLLGGGCALLVTGPIRAASGEPLVSGTLCVVLGGLLGVAGLAVWGAVRASTSRDTIEVLRCDG